MPAYKLQGRTEFQGLPISIENRKGSKRHWYDKEEEREGVTVMKFPYGYIRGTLGMDDDAVDVYLGNEEDSDKVFVITQNKGPDFKEIDEQKVMLGFSSKEKAKLAYLAHMDKPGFFRDIKEMRMDEFKSKLSSLKGKLIKGSLITSTESVKMSDTNEGALEKEKSMSKASDDLKEFAMALTAAFANGISKRARMEARVASYEMEKAHARLGTTRERLPGEPPVVPVRAVNNQLVHPLSTPEVYESCNGCGRMNKSLTCAFCPTRGGAEATPVWKR